MFGIGFGEILVIAFIAFMLVGPRGMPDMAKQFGKWFVSQIQKNHRYTRIGKPNDNSHIERFNRSIQEECLDQVEKNEEALNRAIKKYLEYYNNERLHMGINFKTPSQLLKYVQAIG